MVHFCQRPVVKQDGPSWNEASRVNSSTMPSYRPNLELRLHLQSRLSANKLLRT